MFGSNPYSDKIRVINSELGFFVCSELDFLHNCNFQSILFFTRFVFNEKNTLILIYIIIQYRYVCDTFLKTKI